jgi:hypothetical protein
MCTHVTCPLSAHTLHSPSLFSRICALHTFTPDMLLQHLHARSLKYAPTAEHAAPTAASGHAALHGPCLHSRKTAVRTFITGCTACAVMASPSSMLPLLLQTP